MSHLDSIGTITTSEKDDMHTIISASKRGTEMEKIRVLLGISKKTWYGHTILPDEEMYQHKERKGRGLTPLQ